MGKVIAVCNQKGGVGKSTTAFCIAAGLRLRGLSVLTVDTDPQSNLTFCANVDAAANLPQRTVLQVLVGDAAADAILHTGYMDIIPGSPALAGADALLTGVGKEYRLREALEPCKAAYDAIIIDTPPALGILTVNALVAADACLIPAQADILSLQGVLQLQQTIQTVRKYCNSGLEIFGILATRCNLRTVAARDILSALEDIAQQMGTRVFSTRIRECTALRESQIVKQAIFEYAPRSSAARDYTSLLDEIGGFFNEQEF